MRQGELITNCAAAQAAKVIRARPVSYSASKTTCLFDLELQKTLISRYKGLIEKLGIRR